MTITLHPGDNRESLKRLIAEGVRVHSVVTDPPYGLVSVQKRFGKEGSAPARTEKNDGSFARLSGGFMGKAWDGSGIERDPEFWKLIHDILLPGGYVFAFSGSRTGHWQACAMEMAGFIMHPMHGWVFGSGFPKAHAADKAIDKALGVEGHVNAAGNPVKRMIPGADQQKNTSWIKDNGREYQPGEYVPGSPEATEWDGWAYGTQAQKPALEPIYLGQRPFDCKTGAANLLKHGVGAVNIDGCRVPHGEQLRDGTGKLWSHYRFGEDSAERRYTEEGSTNFAMKPGPRGGAPEGRHPANLILDGSENVISMFPVSKGQRGDLKAHGNPRQSPNGIFGGIRPALDHPARNDEGSAARFFHNFSLSEEDYQLAILAGIIGEDRADPLFYNAKAGKTDRGGSKHPTVKPIALMQYLIRHITPPGGIVLDPFAGSGTTAEAALKEGFECVLMEAEPEYLDFLRKRFDLPGPHRFESMFDDLLGEAAPIDSTNGGSNNQFEDILG